MNSENEILSFWRACCRRTGLDENTPYSAWQFGDDPDRLADLILRGIKTATASAYDLYAPDGEPIPAVGEISVILDSNDAPVCVIRTTRVTVVPFCEVSERHAWLEGERGRTLADWQDIHRAYFADELRSYGLQFSETMPVVCEEFELFYRPRTPILETERLILREYVPEDFDALREIISDAETMKFYDKPYDDAGVTRWLEWNFDNYQNLGFGLFAIERKEDRRFIGDCGITMQIIDHKILPEIGYHIHKDFWNRGYATEAARACRDWAFTHTPFERLYSYMNADNVGSYSVARKNGMRELKQYSDGSERLRVFAISRKEWEAEDAGRS